MKHATSNKAYMRARHQRLESSGLCTHCGRTPARPGRKTCADCGAKNSKIAAARVLRLYPINAALGVCVVCNARKAMAMRKWCGVCSEANTERQARARAKRRQQVAA